MKRKIDNLGRVCIPTEYRTELGIGANQEVEITREKNRIIITSSEGMRSKEEIEEAYRNIKDLAESEYTKGFADAMKFVLKKEGEK